MALSFVVDLVRDPNAEGSFTRSTTPNLKVAKAFAAIAVALVTVAVPTLCMAQSDVITESKVHTPKSWPRFLGSQYNGSASPAADFDFSSPPKLLWSIDVGSGYGVPSIEGSRVFQMDAGPPPAGGDQIAGGRIERQRCFDLETGEMIWSESEKIAYRDMLGYEDGPRSSPTIVGDRVYTQGVTGLLTCRDTSNGKKIWMVDTNAKFGVVQNFFGVASAPLVIGDQVISMIGGSPATDQDFPPMRLDRVTPNGSAVVAFDRHTGKELWKCGDDLASYSSPILTMIAGDELILLFSRSGLMAIDPKTASVRWNFNHRAEILESVNGMVPIIDGDYIFISECYEVGSVLLKANRNSVEVVWRDPPGNRRRQSMRSHWSTPVLKDGFLFGCSGRNAPDSDFRCINFMTGEVMWSDSRRIRSAVTRLGDHLLVMEERGVFQVLKANPEKFELIAEWDFGQPDGNRPAMMYPCWSAPVVVADRLIVRGDNRVLCLKLTQRVDDQAKQSKESNSK